MMYPKEVEQISQKVYNCYKEGLIEEFDTKDVKWLKNTALKAINDFFLKKFLDDGELILKDEKEAYELTKYLYAHVSIDSLKLKGLVDTIEDENGEEIIFLTRLGKEYSEILFNK